MANVDGGQVLAAGADFFDQLLGLRLAKLAFWGPKMGSDVPSRLIVPHAMPRPEAKPDAKPAAQHHHEGH